MNSTERRFSDALDGVVSQIRHDRSILAAILCGSLSHDTVWEKSDIDLALVTIDDRLIEGGHLSLNADGVNVHAFLVPRTQFRKLVDGAIHNSFLHSLLAKGRVIYTHDETIADLCAGLAGIGKRDTDVQLLRAATEALPAIYKAHKWLVTRNDLDYTALWILYAATPLAQIEVFRAGQLADREVIPQAFGLNPSLFTVIYKDLLNAKKTAKAVRAALDAVDAYMADHAPRLFRPVLEYLKEAGDARSCKEIEAHFKRHFDVEGVTTACEYLADEGLIGKASAPAHLTKKSHVHVQELAFFSLS